MFRKDSKMFTPGRTSQRPPAASIFFFAPSVNLCAETVERLLELARPEDLQACRGA